MRTRLTLAGILFAVLVMGLTMPVTVWSAGIENYENGSPIAGMAGAE